MIGVHHAHDRVPFNNRTRHIFLFNFGLIVVLFCFLIFLSLALASAGAEWTFGETRSGTLELCCRVVPSVVASDEEQSQQKGVESDVPAGV